MIDALHSDVDGKLWAKTSGGPDPGHANKLYQFDLATEKFHEVLPAAGKRDIAAYGLVTDLDNNVYGLDNNPDQRQIWRTSAKSGETTYIDLPLGVGGARRGHIDSQNCLWFSQFHANAYAMYDPKSGHITQWEVPVAYAGAYDVQFDEGKYAWGADMSTDLVQRLNVETGEWSSVSPAHFHQYAPYRRAEEYQSQRPLQHVDRRPAVEQDCPHRGACAVTKLFVTARSSTPKERRGARRLRCARRDRAGKTSYRWGTSRAR